MKKLLVVLLVLCFAAPAMAADWYFYGKVRPQAGYYDTDDYAGGGPALDATIGGGDDEGLMWALSSSSRLGAKVVASETLTGLFELAVPSGDVSTRIAWGTWDFGGGKLSLGQYYTPATFLGYSSMMADIGDGGYGNMLLSGMPYIGRNPQFRLSFGSLDLAFIEHNNVSAFHPGADIDFDLPRIEAAYVFRLSNINIRPIAGFQTYDVELGGGQEETIDSYLLGLGASFDLRPAYVKLTGTYLQNATNYGDLSIMSGGFVSSTGMAQFVGGDIEDSDTVKGTLVAGFNINKMVNIEAGIGYMDGEVDTADGTLAETAFLYYLQSRIGLADGLDMYPGIGLVDLDERELNGVSTDRGKMFYANIAFDLYF